MWSARSIKNLRNPYDVGDCMSYCETARITVGGPLVSVVIPVYNVSRYLPQCMDSVIRQTYRNMEIILVDDGSTDGSGRICDEYAQRDARVCVVHSLNKGLASARNLGLDHIRGEYISFVDSDDWIEPHTIETLISTAINTGADIAVAGRCSEYIGKTVSTQKKDYDIKVFQGEEILEAYAKGVFYDVVWNKLYCRECFDRITFPDGHNYEDVFTTPSLLGDAAEQGKKVAAVSEELFHFRMRKSSITHTYSLGNLVDCWEAYHRKFEVMPEYKELLLSSCYMAIGRMWRTYCGLSREERAEAASVVRKMQELSREQFLLVMKGNYSRITKLICLVSQSRAAVVLWGCYFWGRGCSLNRNAKYRLFE